MPGLSSIDDLLRRLGGAMPSQGRVAAEVDPEVMRYLADTDETLMAAMDRDGAARALFGPDSGARAIDGRPGYDFMLTRNLDAAPAPPATPDMGIETDLFGDMYKSAGAYDNLRKGRTPNLRNSGGDLARIAGDNIRRADDAARQAQKTAKLQDDLLKIGVAGGVAAAAGGVGMMAVPDTAPGASAKVVPSKPAPEESDLLTSGNPADLVEETRPAPRVPAQDDVQPQVAKAPTDYSAKARELINRLNDMRRQAGGEVPQAKEMMAEIDRLLALGNEQRREPDFQPGDDASAKFKQAQAILDQLNAMYREGLSPQSQQAQQMMAEVRKLQAEGDAMRNNRTSGPAPQVPAARGGGRGKAQLPTGSGSHSLLPGSRSLPRRSSPSDT